MKNIAIAVLMITFGKPVFAQIGETDLTKLSLRGKVKQVFERDYTSDVSADTSGTISKIKLDFDQSGYLFDAIGSGPVATDSFKYEKNRKIEKLYLRKRLYTTLISIYDDQGHEIEMDRILGSGRDTTSKIMKMKYKTTYKYDAIGNRVEEDNDDPVPAAATKIIMRYNNKNKKTESDSYSSDGKLIEKVFYQYDSLGNEIKYKTYNGEGKLVFEHTTSYGNFDEKGNWLLQVNVSKNHNPVQNGSPYKFIIKRKIFYYE